MRQQLKLANPGAQPLLRRLDHLLGELNFVLLIVATGLAVLDITCFVALRAAAGVVRGQLGSP